VTHKKGYSVLSKGLENYAREREGQREGGMVGGSTALTVGSSHTQSHFFPFSLPSSFPSFLFYFRPFFLFPLTFFYRKKGKEESVCRIKNKEERFT